MHLFGITLTVSAGVLVRTSGDGAVVILVRDDALVGKTTRGRDHGTSATSSTVEVDVHETIGRSRHGLEGAKVGGDRSLGLKVRTEKILSLGSARGGGCDRNGPEKHSKQAFD